MIKFCGKQQLQVLSQLLPDETATIIDVGAGINPQDLFHAKKHICIEPCLEYAKILKQQPSNNKTDNYHISRLQKRRMRNLFVINDTALSGLRNCGNKSVDSVFLIDVIEHMDKRYGRAVIEESKRVARKQIILFTPLGYMKQECNNSDPWGLDNKDTSWQDHKSGWTPADFQGWDILACKEYHTVNGLGQTYDPPVGAFWAVKTMQKDWQTVIRYNLINLMPNAEKLYHYILIAQDLYRKAKYNAK